MLAGLPVPADAIEELAGLTRTTGAELLADRPERAFKEGVALLALTIDEHAIILASLEDPAEGLSELRAVLMNEHQWRQEQGFCLEGASLD